VKEFFLHVMFINLPILASTVVWDTMGIAVYFWPRGSIPIDIALGFPRPDWWPLPAGRWPSSTCSLDHFYQQIAVLDTTLCGDWAGNAWDSTNFEGQVSSCHTMTGYSTCSAYVQAEGAAFGQACRYCHLFLNPY
jgi:hypothetical protein